MNVITIKGGHVKDLKSRFVYLCLSATIQFISIHKLLKDFNISNIMGEGLSFEEFVRLLSDKKLIVFGEIHGTKEIPEIISNILLELKLRISRIFLEIPKKNQRYINKYLKSYNKEDLYKIPFFKQKIKDGRDSKQNLELIKVIGEISKLNKKLKIFCIAPDSNLDKDYYMYKKIKKFLGHKKINIFITGNIHASEIKIKLNDKRIIPATYYLKKWLGDKLIVVNFMANEGQFYNSGIKDIKSKKDKRKGIFLSKIENYDLEYRISKVSPCDFL